MRAPAGPLQLVCDCAHRMPSRWQGLGERAVARVRMPAFVCARARETVSAPAHASVCVSGLGLGHV